MAHSKAKKLRQKLEREGRRNPEHNRSPFAFSDLRTRKTKSKKDVLYRFKHKNHFSTNGKDDSFYFLNSFPKNSLKVEAI
nr:hypothetical protein [Bacillus suaedae]